MAIRNSSPRRKPVDKRGGTARYPLIPIGTVFGRLTVLKNNLLRTYGQTERRACRLQCVCKNKIVAPYNHLKSGKTKSCGCAVGEHARKIAARAHPLIPIGTRFGRWTVIETGLYKEFESQTHRACRVRCECEAATEAIRTYGELRCGRSPSCGCKSRQRSIETAWRDLLNALKRRGWEFHLTLPQLKAVVKLPCVYCGKEPSNLYRVKYKVDGVYQRGVDSSMEIVWSGLDRVDSTLGYIHGNVVPCCGACNGMKSKLPLAEFLAFVARIHAHHPTVAGVHKLAAGLFDGVSEGAQ